jgi:hypothetical protein
VYKVKFDKSSLDLSADYERLSDIEKERISDLDALSFFDFDDSGKYVFYIITDSIEMDSYLEILSENFIRVKCEDLSDDILRSKVDLIYELSYHNDTINSIRYGFFVEELNDWIYQNLEMDMVLDRISEVGMKRLNSIEKEFLKNYNK